MRYCYNGKVSGASNSTKFNRSRQSHSQSRYRGRTSSNDRQNSVDSLGDYLELRDKETEDLVNRMNENIGEYRSEIRKVKLCVNNVIVDFECVTGSWLTLCSVHKHTSGISLECD